MPALTELLGATLHKKAGDNATAEVKTVDALAGKHVALYFSAAWCGPCRNFTPMLKEFHAHDARSSDFEVVFISSDRDETSFNEYYGSHHGDWLALPYADRERKAKLSAKYKVSGIPTLILLSPTGDVITKDADAQVRDQNHAAFPWTPETLDQIVDGVEFQRQDGSTFTAADLKGKSVGLYFSAHWCPPCRRFTPTLAKRYTTAVGGALKDKFELIFVSSDKEQDSFDEYFAEMPWAALPFRYRDAKAKLATLFECQGIPQFTMVDWDTGKVINRNARNEIAADEECENFPWAPPAAVDANSDPSALNEETCIVVLTEDDKAKDTVLAFATQFKVAHPEGEESEFVFHHGDSAGPVAQQIRDRTKTEGGRFVGVLTLPDAGSFYTPTEPVVGDVTAAVLEKLVADFASQSLTKGNF